MKFKSVISYFNKYEAERDQDSTTFIFQSHKKNSIELKFNPRDHTPVT